MASFKIAKNIFFLITYFEKILKHCYAFYLRHLLGFLGNPVDIHLGSEFRSHDQIWIEKSCVIKKGVIIDGRSVKKHGIRFGPECYIKENCYIDAYDGYIHLLGQIAIGQYSIIAGQGGVEIGKYTILGAHCYILSSNHKFTDLDIPYILQGDIVAPVHIEQNVWIGGGCIILPGVTIGRNSVIGAGSIVTTNIKPNSVYTDRSPRIIEGFLHRKTSYEDI